MSSLQRRKNLPTLPHEDGFRMPAEWEAHEGCWMAWPIRADNYRLGGLPAQEAWAEVINVIIDYEPVSVFVPFDHFEKVSEVLDPRVRLIETSYDDAWLRDIGPTFVVKDDQTKKTREVRGVDWRFNAWGEMYSSWVHDDAVARKVLEIERIARYRAPLILEGGSIHVDGEGTLLTTEECLLNPNRNPDLSKQQIETYLKNYVGGIEKVIWLPRGLEADEDTNGHIDNMCCFLKPGWVALAWTDDETDPQYMRSQEALKVLECTTDARGRSIQVLKLNVPASSAVRFRSSEDVKGLKRLEETLEDGVRVEGERLAGSYVNFYLAGTEKGKKGLILPSFGEEEADKEAARRLQEFFGGEREVRCIKKAREILLGGGNIHCITQQQPSCST